MNDIKDALENLIREIMGSREAAAEYAADPQGVLAEAGITETSISPQELRAVVEQACADIDLSPKVQSAIAEYAAGPAATGGGASATASAGGGSATASAGGGAAAAPAVTPPPVTAPANQTPLEVVEQHVNYVTYVTYEGDETITNEIINNEITNIDNSTDINLDVGDNNDGDIDIDIDNVNATDGGVAVGEDSGTGNINTGDEAVQVDGDAMGPVNTGENSGTIVGENSGNIVGENSGTITGDISDSVVNTGSGDLTNVETDGGDAGVSTGSGDAFGDVDDASVNTGDGGSAENVSDNEDSAVSTGDGDSTNVSDFGDGASASLGSGDASGASGSFNDNTDSNIETGSGNQNVDEAVTVDTDITVVDVDVDADPVSAVVPEEELILEPTEPVQAFEPGIEDADFDF